MNTNVPTNTIHHIHMSKNIYTNTNLHTNIRMLIANGNINTPTDTNTQILIKCSQDEY